MGNIDADGCDQAGTDAMVGASLKIIYFLRYCQFVKGNAGVTATGFQCGEEADSDPIQLQARIQFSGFQEQVMALFGAELINDEVTGIRVNLQNGAVVGFGCAGYANAEQGALPMNFF